MCPIERVIAKMDGAHLPPDATLASNRRAARRNPVAWEGEIAFRGRSLACTVLDISPSGARLRVPLPISRETPVRLNVPGKGIFRGDVRWRDGELIGIKFLNGLRCHDGPDEQEQTESRQDIRYETPWQGHLVSDKGNIHCLILDVSIRGARILVEGLEEIGDQVSLSIEAVDEIQGRIVWRIGEVIGIDFLEQRPDLIQQLVGGH